MDGNIPPPATAQASDHECSLYGYHFPKPTRTQYHHSKPVYLQNRVYGHIVYPADTWLCGTCHDSVHDWISYLLGEGRLPDPEPGRYAKKMAQKTVDWYISERGAVDG
jgi:hypothetical protein